MTSFRKILIGITGFLGLLIVGGLSNGVWEYILQPLTNFLLQSALYVSTLGINSYRDDIYLQVAKNFHESSSIVLYALFITTILAIGAGIFLSSFILSDLKKKIKAGTGIGKYKKFVKIVDHKLSRYIIFAYLIFAFAFFTIDIIRETYINESITYYTQSLKIITPYISSKQHNDFESKFSSIKNRQDFIDLISQMRVIADNNKTNLPKFDFVF